MREKKNRCNCANNIVELRKGLWGKADYLNKSLKILTKEVGSDPRKNTVV